MICFAFYFFCATNESCTPLNHFFQEYFSIYILLFGLVPLAARIWRGLEILPARGTACIFRWLIYLFIWMLSPWSWCWNNTGKKKYFWQGQKNKRRKVQDTTEWGSEWSVPRVCYSLIHIDFSALQLKLTLLGITFFKNTFTVIFVIWYL